MIDLKKTLLEFGIKAPEILLPREKTAFWPVVACDQYTSEPEYWQRVESKVKDKPSAFHLILPEIYLGGADEDKRIMGIHAAMESYIKEGVLNKLEEGFVLVKRTVLGKERLGLIASLDLERYDFSTDSKSLIRATEGTIKERIPPRLKVREGAKLELPHAIVLVDDPNRTLIEPLSALELEKLYDIELMESGGRVEGRFLPLAMAKGLCAALAGLCKDGLLFAVGDGNHSLAAAKTAWESLKKTLPDDALEDHPARFALVEIENVHDAGIEFEAIHRVVFGIKPMAFLSELCAKMNARCQVFDDEAAQSAALEEPIEGQRVPFVFEGSFGVLYAAEPAHTLACGTLQMALDEALKAFPEASVDYVHGDDVAKELGVKKGCVGFILPAMEKRELFAAVLQNGPLPRKAFSMGHANEKRFYLEARRIMG